MTQHVCEEQGLFVNLHKAKESRQNSYSIHFSRLSFRKIGLWEQA
jgi:hypothetical protein